MPGVQVQEAVSPLTGHLAEHGVQGSFLKCPLPKTGTLSRSGAGGGGWGQEWQEESRKDECETRS